MLAGSAPARCSTQSSKTRCLPCPACPVQAHRQCGSCHPSAGGPLLPATPWLRVVCSTVRRWAAGPGSRRTSAGIYGVSVRSVPGAAPRHHMRAASRPPPPAARRRRVHANVLQHWPVVVVGTGYARVHACNCGFAERAARCGGGTTANTSSRAHKQIHFSGHMCLLTTLDSHFMSWGAQASIDDYWDCCPGGVGADAAARSIGRYACGRRQRQQGRSTSAAFAVLHSAH